jgi:hypothetical protein
LCLLVWCKACGHQSPTENLQAIINARKGDVPLKDALTSALRAGGAGGSYGECDPILGISWPQTASV